MIGIDEKENGESKESKKSSEVEDKSAKSQVQSPSSSPCESDGKITVSPSFYINVWNNWFNGMQDWCISRQLWWGHRIPAYIARLKTEGGIPLPPETADTKWYIARSSEEALQQAAADLKVDCSEIELIQDEDVLDTWFSSGLFTFSILGFPNDDLIKRTKDKAAGKVVEDVPKTDLELFYPTTVMETAYDILFFWVARMVMMSLHVLIPEDFGIPSDPSLNPNDPETCYGLIPFGHVFLHSLIR
jgi:valyl-tRNA synthetase